MFAFTDLPLLPIIGLVVCAVLGLRLAIGPARRARLDAAAVRAWQRLRAGTLGLVRQRRARGTAQREADELIRRARRGGGPGIERDGNVYRPRSFGGPARGERHEPREPREPRERRGRPGDDPDRPDTGDGAGDRGGRTLH